jgi:hypothetical protein
MPSAGWRVIGSGSGSSPVGGSLREVRLLGGARLPRSVDGSLAWAGRAYELARPLADVGPRRYLHLRPACAVGVACVPE